MLHAGMSTEHSACSSRAIGTLMTRRMHPATHNAWFRNGTKAYHALPCLRCIQQPELMAGRSLEAFSCGCSTRILQLEPITVRGGMKRTCGNGVYAVNRPTLHGGLSLPFRRGLKPMLV